FWCLTDGAGCFVQGDGAKTPIPQVWWARWAQAESGLKLIAGQKGGGLLIIDPNDPEQPKSLKTVGRLREVLGVSGDKVSVLMRDEARVCSLVHIDVAKTKVLETIEMPMCIESAKMVPDGRIVGTAVVTHPDDVPGDAEVVVWEPGQKVPFQLTTGSFHEEIVYPAHDGSKVFFNRRLESPSDARFDTQVYRRAVCEVELPER
ncbi:MAG: hypothetical protein KC912_23155, partial [Proteobacteria bacterium]|nr:hypothetical protein [Pseudomonadota bacterium]